MLNAKNHDKEAKIIADAGRPGAITLATNMAGRGVDIMLGGQEPPKNTPEHKAWQKEHERVIALGGLHVIGTERHESRRIDNQLRGRAGRQGDAGSSQFYVSMDDDLMRIFGGDRMKSIMTTLRVPEDVPVENKLISRSIENAQKKVEGNNFDIRKHLVEYDDVINKHREAIYRRREQILKTAAALGEDETKEGLSALTLEIVEREIEQIVSFHTAAEKIEDWDIKEIYQTATTIFPVQEKLKETLSELVEGNYKLDKVKIRTAIIEHLSRLAGDHYKELEKKAKEAGVNWSEIEKSVLIRSIDTLWVEHLEAMSSMRQGIGLRGYGQRDPLLEYKKEAFRLYSELNNLIQKEVVYSIYKVGDVSQFIAPSLIERAKQFQAPAKIMDSSSSSFSGFKPATAGNMSGSAGAGRKQPSVITAKTKDASGKKVGRNDPCPCGATKADGTPVKYKHCHGK